MNLKIQLFHAPHSFPDIYLCHCISFVSISQQARAEQEEEFISNTLFKKIQALQKEKETLAVNYEKEEEFLTNELSRKLMQVSDVIKIVTYLIATVNCLYHAQPDISVLVFDDVINTVLFLMHSCSIHFWLPYCEVCSVGAN